MDMLDEGLGAVLSQVVEGEGITRWYLALQPFKFQVIQRMLAVANFLFRLGGRLDDYPARVGQWGQGGHGLASASDGEKDQELNW